VPTPATRCVLGIGALAATLILMGSGAGTAMADPDDPGTDTETSTEPGTPPEPEPTVTPTVVPRTLQDQLRDLLHRPLSVFGNGRIPGQPVVSTPTPPEAPTPAAKKSKGNSEAGAPREPEVVKPESFVPNGSAWKSASTAEIRLPFTPAFSVPVPTVPGTEGLQWSVNLTDPYAAYSTVEQTFNTVNSLLADAYAPYNPFPPPKPEPTFKITGEEPVAEADGGGGGAPQAMSSTAAGDMPVLQVPMAPPRMAPPRGFTEPVRGNAVPEVLGGGTAGAQVPGLRGAVNSSGTAVAEPVPGVGATPVSPQALRLGYPQYLRSARLGEVATIALPGIAGLLAITASGSVIGYRQANSGRYLREGAVRFMR